MQVDYIIIGQGISGTWLSYYLDKEGRSFIVIDNNQPNAPSRLAAGIINPVTGRRHAAVWMADELLPYAWKAYTAMGEELNIRAISKRDVIDFFPTAQMRLSFQQRVEDGNPFVSLDETAGDLRQLFNYDLGYGQIKPVYTAHLETIIPAWRTQLKQKQQLLEEEFELPELHIAEEKITYRNITAGKIIFCDGNSSVLNPYFSRLPFAPNKGEAIVAEIPELPAQNIYKKGLMLVPLATPGLWWIGASYEWEFSNDQPTEAFLQKTQFLLKSWLKVSFDIKEQICGIRTATLERRPFVGIHPVHKRIGILNGMGTKGCSLAPYFARQLTDHLLYDQPVIAEAAINRFSRILSR